MKKWLGLVLASLPLLIVCANNSAVGPLSDNYDETNLFKAQVIKDNGNGSGEVRVYWLAEKLSQGDSPFSFGPLDAEWTTSNMIALSKKTADGKYYTYTAVFQFGTRYRVGAGLNWSGSDIDSFRWLTPNEQAGCAYYDPSTGNMAFTPNSDYSVIKG